MIDGDVEIDIESYRRGKVVVVKPVGRLDRTGVEQILVAARACTGSPVVVDLTDCIATDPNALADLAAADGNPVSLCFVSRRPTSRRLLARSAVTSRFAVFHHLEDALQARTFADAGYGHGWRNP